MAIHVVGYIITITLLPAMTHPKHDSAFVFTEFINNSGWTYDGIAFCAGIMTSVYGFGGIESAAHFAVRFCAQSSDDTNTEQYHRRKSSTSLRVCPERVRQPQTLA